MMYVYCKTFIEVENPVPYNM